jgi:tetratricopeptide (TPR) repeat protein
VRLRYLLNKAGSVPTYSVKRQLYLDSALAIVPDNAQLWQQKAMPLFKQQKYEVGMPFLDSAVKYDTEKHWLEYRAFMKCIFQKSYRAALIDFNRAQKQNGNSYIMDHQYEFYKGLCYLQLNEFDSAEYLLNKVIAAELKERKEAHQLHWFYLGVVKYEQENYAEAIQNFDKSLLQYVHFSDAQYYKAMCLMRQQKLQASLDLLLLAQENLQLGYTLNEDNAIYEAYPYQLNRHFLKTYLEMMRQAVKEKR